MIKYYTFFILFIIVLFSGCNKYASTKILSNKMVGSLVDANVSGVQYECSNDNISGITDKNGYFYFSKNCSVLSFKLGNTILASIDTQNIPLDNTLYITDLVGVDRNDSNNTKVINIIRLLQTFDIDDNPHNGIQISQKTRDNISNYYIQEVKDITSEQELQNILSDANYSRTLISTTKALSHFEQTLRANNINIDTVAPYLPELGLQQFTLDSGKVLLKKDGNITIIASSLDKLTIRLYAEQNSSIAINNTNTNIIMPVLKDQHSYIDNLDLNTSQLASQYVQYNITATDNTGKVSTPLQLRILKDINRPDFNISATEFNVTIPNTFITDINSIDVDINTTDTDCDNLIVYEVVSDNKNLFDINSSGVLQFKTNDTPKDYNVTIRITDFARHFKEQTLLIHSVN